MKEKNAAHFRKILSKTKLVYGLVLVLFLLTSRCSKDTVTIDQPFEGILTSNSPDLTKRLQGIRSKYERDNLKDKLHPNKTDKLSWVPDWNHPKIQVVNDSTSYVFFPLIGHIRSEGKNLVAKQVNGRVYLLVKNEQEFYKAYYYSPEVKSNNQSNIETNEFQLKGFSGNLLLTGLQNNGNFLLQYVNGRLSDSYLKKRLSAPRKIQSIDGSVSYWEQQCQTVIRNCQYSTLGDTHCGGVIIYFSFNCNWPPSMCGYTFSLIDYSEDTVCENVWFPDPPTNPGDNPGGGGGGGGDDGGFTPAPLPLLSLDSNTRPCIDTMMGDLIDAAKMSITVAKIMEDIHGDHAKAQNAILNLSTNPNVNIKIGEETIQPVTITNPNGTTSLSETHGRTNPTTGNIKLNSLMLNEATEVAIASTMIHELMHSYFVWGANNLTGDDAMAFSDLNRYLFSQENGLPHPYNYPQLGALQHLQMAETYANSMTDMLLEYVHSKGIYSSPDPNISLWGYCNDIFWGSLQQTSGLDAPNPTRSSSNANKEFKNQSGSTGRKGCQP